MVLATRRLCARARCAETYATLPRRHLRCRLPPRRHRRHLRCRLPPPPPSPLPVNPSRVEGTPTISVGGGSSGLPIGALVGIIAGGVVAGLLVFGLLIYCLVKKKPSAKKQKPANVEDVKEGGHAVEGYAVQFGQGAGPNHARAHPA